MKLSTSNMALIAGAAVLVVAVLWMPRVPSSSEPAAPVVESSPIELAIAKVSGENPMEGIMELRAMADEEPPNLEAVLWLGRFAVQSGQLEKARELIIIRHHHLCTPGTRDPMYKWKPTHT